MARFCVQNLAISNDENWPNSIKFCQKWLKFLPNVKLILTKIAITFKISQKWFKILPNYKFGKPQKIAKGFKISQSFQNQIPGVRIRSLKKVISRNSLNSSSQIALKVHLIENVSKT